MLMSQILSDDKQLMKMVDKARLEDEQRIKGKQPLGTFGPVIEQDICPDNAEFDVEEIQDEFKMIKDTNQRFQEFVNNFQQNEKLFSTKFREMKVDYGLFGEAIEDDLLRNKLLLFKKQKAQKSRLRTSLMVDDNQLPRQSNSQSRVKIEETRS